MKEFLVYYLNNWIVSIPLTLYILYKVITEVLDLILNAGKINNLLKGSDSVNYESLNSMYGLNKIKISKIDTSRIQGLEKRAQECIVPSSLYQKAKKLFNIFKG